MQEGFESGLKSRGGVGALSVPQRKFGSERVFYELHCTSRNGSGWYYLRESWPASPPSNFSWFSMYLQQLKGSAIVAGQHRQLSLAVQIT